MFTLTKRVSILTKCMGHEKHMVILACSFDKNDHFDQVLNHKPNKKEQVFEMVHQDAHGLVNLAILHGHV